MVATPAPPTVQLAEFAAGLTIDHVPAPVLDQARYVVLDTVAAMAAGARWQTTAAPLAIFASSLGTGDSSLVGTAERGSVAGAAFVNGALSHGLNFDTLGPGNAHVGCSAVPAVLAIAERERLTGAEFLTAVVVAAEVVSRIAATAAGAGPRAGLMLGQVHGYFATAAGCARALSLTEGATAAALGHALMQAAGTMEVMRLGDADAKETYAGFANLGGIVAADLARSGVGNAATALEGAYGYFPLVLGVGEDRLAPLVEGLGSSYLSASIYYKRWPLSINVERYVAALADAGGELPAVDAVEGVRIDHLAGDHAWIHPAAERTAPATLAGAANSIPYSLASFLVDRAGYLGALDPDLLREPRRLALAAAIDTREVDADEGRAVVLRIGRGRELRVPVPERPGAPSGQHPSERKLRTVWRSREGIGVDDVVEMVAAIGEAPSLEPLCRALRSVDTGRDPASVTR